MTKHPAAWVDQWLSRDRFAPYLAAASGDHAAGLELYLWNGEVSAALLTDLGHVEIALRNAYDRALTSSTSVTASTAITAPTAHWLFDPGSPVNRSHVVRGRDANARSRAQIAEAIRRAGRGAPAGKVIAELPFGFWAHMSDTSREHTLWTPHLKFAYPRRTPRHSVSALVNALNVIRNRAAHHETLIRHDIAEQHARLIQLAGLLLPELATLIRDTSPVRALLTAQPIR